jgi:hypothetical protein
MLGGGHDDGLTPVGRFARRAAQPTRAISPAALPWRPPPSGRRQGRVRICGPFEVTATVCSAWAARSPVRERSVHPSGSVP